MQKWAVRILLLSIIAIAVMLAFRPLENPQEPVVKQETSTSEVSTSVTVPPTPIPDISGIELGKVEQQLPLLEDQPNYFVEGMAADRRQLFDLFPPEFQPYLLSVDFVWLWGDGGSSLGPVASHEYPRAGRFIIRLEAKISTRGEDVTVSAEYPFEVREFEGHPQIAFDMGNLDLNAVAAGTHSFEVANNSGVAAAVFVKVSDTGKDYASIESPETKIIQAWRKKGYKLIVGNIPQGLQFQLLAYPTAVNPAAVMVATEVVSF